MSKKWKKLDREAIQKAGPPLVSLKVSFGPTFTEGKSLSYREFVQKLRSQAKLHSKSFLSTMMDHFADHIESAAEDGIISLDHPADTNPNTTYYGQGSCTGCPGDDGSGAQCCLCVYNGQNVGCEFCN